jgi:hypothetical protein
MSSFDNIEDNDLRFVYVPPGDNTVAISSLITDLNNKSHALDNTYILKVKRIQETIYNHQEDDLKLKKMLDSAINDQRKQDELYFKKYQDQQTADISKMLNDTIIANAVQTYLDKNPKNISSIKSMYNQNLALTKIDSSDNYLININNNCLSIDPTSKVFSLKTCNTNSQNQRFTIHSIHDDVTFHQMYNEFPTLDKISQFPYNIVRSTVANYCLTDTKQGVSLSPCKSLEGQKWVGLRNTNNTCLNKN